MLSHLHYHIILFRAYFSTTLSTFATSALHHTWPPPSKSYNQCLRPPNNGIFPLYLIFSALILSPLSLVFFLHPSQIISTSPSLSLSPCVHLSLLSTTWSDTPISIYNFRTHMSSSCLLLPFTTTSSLSIQFPCHHHPFPCALYSTTSEMLYLWQHLSRSFRRSENVYPGHSLYFASTFLIFFLRR